MIDVHFHCLPGIDDGPANLEDAAALCRAAADDGVTTIVATPHVLRGRFGNEDPVARKALVETLNARLGGRPKIVSGCEYTFSSEMLELAERGAQGPLTGLNGGRYLLVELPPDAVRRPVESAFHEISLLGVTPVVAHPERHGLFRSDPGALEGLLRAGAVAQITAGSLLGEFGETARAAAADLLRRGFVSLVASDSHDLVRRAPRLAAAREWVRRMWGGEVEEGIFEANPEAVLASKPIPWTAAMDGAANRVSR